RKYQNMTKSPVARGYLHEVDGKIELVEDDKGYISIWQMPVENMNYALGADVAEGLISGDYSCAFVGNDEFDLVARWHGHIDPDLFGKELVKLGRFYNDAYIGVENNNHGLTTLTSITKEE